MCVSVFVCVVAIVNLVYLMIASGILIVLDLLVAAALQLVMKWLNLLSSIDMNDTDRALDAKITSINKDYDSNPTGQRSFVRALFVHSLLLSANSRDFNYNMCNCTLSNYCFAGCYVE